MCCWKKERKKINTRKFKVLRKVFNVHVCKQSLLDLRNTHFFEKDSPRSMRFQGAGEHRKIKVRDFGSFLVQKTQYMYISQQNSASQTYCFQCFPRSFVLLFPVVLHQLCLLHQIGAGKFGFCSRKKWGDSQKRKEVREITFQETITKLLKQNSRFTCTCSLKFGVSKSLEAIRCRSLTYHRASNDF